MSAAYDLEHDKLSIHAGVIDVPRYLPSYLEIRYSKIPDGGMGVFAKQDIPKGTFLGNYMGFIYTGDRLSTIKGNSYQFDTVIRGQNAIIDAIDVNKSNWTRFMNCALAEQDENVCVMKNKCSETTDYFNGDGKKIELDGAIVFFACVDIAAGEELLYNYGERYKNKLLSIFMQQAWFYSP